jgi:lysophospholipase L1-like esterase
MKPLLCVLLFSAVATGALSQTAGAPPAASPSNLHESRKPWELEWAYLSRYRDANIALGLPSASEHRVVFMGDSITEGWANIDPGFFSRTGYIDRGIGGQTTSQMLVRFRQDVIMLRPAVVVILGGTNDIAQNGGITTPEAIEENLQSMAELARVNGISVVISSVLTAIDFPWRKGLQPAGKIVALNHWIEDYCANNQLVYANYFPSLVDGNGGLKAEFSPDGVHPNGAGYRVMDSIAQDAVRASLKQK